MDLTPAQLATLKAAILAETDPGFVALRDAGATGQMADWYNVTASPTHALWRTDAPVSAIMDAVSWDVYTPSDPSTDAGLPDALACNRRTTRLLVIQTKQMNLQTMLQGRLELDATKATVRAGLRDATIQVPSGANGADRAPGGSSGATVLAACTRSATRGEKLYATTPAQTGNTTAFLPGPQGNITNENIIAALAA